MLALHSTIGVINIAHSPPYFSFADCLAALWIKAVHMLAHCWRTLDFILSMLHALALGQQVTGDVLF